MKNLKNWLQFNENDNFDFSNLIGSILSKSLDSKIRPIDFLNTIKKIGGKFGFKGGIVDKIDVKFNELEEILKKNQEILKEVNPNLRNLFINLQVRLIIRYPQNAMVLPLKYGVRDPDENKKAKGAKKSSHLRGLAVDIVLPKSDKDYINRLIDISSELGALGIGVYRDAQHLHIDIDSGLGRRAWGSDYSSKSIPSWAKDSINKHLKGNKKTQPTKPQEPQEPIINLPTIRRKK